MAVVVSRRLVEGWSEQGCRKTVGRQAIGSSPLTVENETGLFWHHLAVESRRTWSRETILEKRKRVVKKRVKGNGIWMEI